MHTDAGILADVAPSGPFDALLGASLAAVAVPFLFGFLILAAARIHRNRARRQSENAHDDA